MKNKATKGKGRSEDESKRRSERLRFVGGAALTALAIYLFFAFIAYLFWWRADQSIGGELFSGSDVQVRNWAGKSGNWLASLFINKGFGLAALLIPVIIGAVGLRMLNVREIRARKVAVKLSVAIIIISVTLGFLFGMGGGFLGSGPGGAHGYSIAIWLNAFMGKIGTASLITVSVLGYMVFALGVKPESIKRCMIPSAAKEATGCDESVLSKRYEGEVIVDMPEEELVTGSGREEDPDPAADDSDTPDGTPPSGGSETDSGIRNYSGSIIRDLDDIDTVTPGRGESDGESRPGDSDNGISLTITKAGEGDSLSDEEVQKKLESYDPRLDLPRYMFPPLTMLKDYKSTGGFDDKEVRDNKEKIVSALSDHKISIRSISATVGPTVTLYEIVPERGVRISRIKSLENDIALSLSALGIRIIAPIPGRGTVGLEVPNKKPEIVSMRSLITSKAFQESRFEVALALGRTITNEPFIVDLTKIPHLLVAGATGQGKSVGLNAIITSILFRKHPAELKFVLIDPKRVELPLYARIERHYLAKLPGDEDAIITDTQKVITTLNSLCIEMDNRLELLKLAGARHIKEYNDKFISRRLNPEKGHKYMPYIVLIIDEFADLIMTAGREIEGPIGRLAQLARAIGIHLIISTQRPSTNIITGFIKANFPVRIAFRVFSSVDSRTILDATGADRLVGRGDMLISTGSEPVRVQCAFIDTPEIEELTGFIGAQQGYTDAFMLPEYIDDSDSGANEIDLRKRDGMFNEAARLVVQHQQGSTSLIQRKLSIGYNRAGRIVDQLEAAGILGPFEGSKARDVLITDMMSLEQILNNLE